MKKQLRTNKLMRKIAQRKKAFKFNKTRLKYYAKEIKQVALTPAVLGATAAAAGAALLWFVPRKFRHQAVAVAVPEVKKHSRSLMKFAGRGIALVSSLSAIANLVKRRH